jgi:putative transposase
MAKFRDIKTLQKVATVHASIHNHFNQDRHLNRRDIFRQNCSAALDRVPGSGVSWRPESPAVSHFGD